MKSKQRVLIIFAVLIFLVIAFYFVTMAITKYTGYVSITENKYDDFAKCLTEKEVKMYGAFGCKHCQYQKEAFGKNGEGEKLLKNMNIYVECDPRGENSQTQLCLDNGIKDYPTWEVNSQLYPGEMSFEKLAQMTGCSLS